MNAATEPSVWKPLPGSRTLCKLFMHLFSDYRVSGLENIPKSPFLLTINHMSYWDAPAAGCQFEELLPTLTARKYKGTWVGLLMHLGTPIWVEQEASDRQALMIALNLLQHGYALAIAPEGTRSKSGALMAAREGAAFIATRANVPILPVAVWGTQLMFKTLRPEAHVQIGKPYRLPEGRAKGDQLTAYTERIMCAIAALLPEQYHGFYAGNPVIAEMAKVVGL